jgi:hypothetical protein
MRLTRTFALLSCLIALAGCNGPTQFTSSLSEAGEIPIDPRLAGRWYGGESDVQSYSSPGGLIVMRADGKDRLRLQVPLPRGDRILLMMAHPSELDGKVYYNAIPDPASYFRAFTKASELPGHLLFRVEFAGDDKIFLWTTFGDGGEWKPASTRSRKIDMADNDSYQLIEVSRDALRELIRGTGPERFLNYRFGPLFRLREPGETWSETQWLRDERSGCMVGRGRSADAVTWSGTCRAGVAAGPGTAEWTMENGQPFAFEGNLIEGLPHGTGRCREGGRPEWKPCRYANGKRMDDDAMPK